jgi:hypothetical protein
MRKAAGIIQSAGSTSPRVAAHTPRLQRQWRQQRVQSLLSVQQRVKGSRSWPLGRKICLTRGLLAAIALWGGIACQETTTRHHPSVEPEKQCLPDGVCVWVWNAYTSVQRAQHGLVATMNELPATDSIPASWGLLITVAGSGGNSWVAFFRDSAGVVRGIEVYGGTARMGHAPDDTAELPGYSTYFKFARPI